MKEILYANSFEELHKIFCSDVSKQAIFRGVKDADNHKLIPSLGRINKKRRGGSSPNSYEHRLLSMFKDQSRQYLKQLPENEMEWLALAQHHGLPTRFLDWSYNPLVATYFAIEQENEGNSAIYIYRETSLISTKELLEPFSIKEVKKYRPPCFDERIRVQKSVFTIHPDPYIEFDDDKISKIIINAECRTLLKKNLGKYGISKDMLFPGLDGISETIVSQISPLHY